MFTNYLRIILLTLLGFFLLPLIILVFLFSKVFRRSKPKTRKLMVFDNNKIYAIDNENS